MTGRRSRLHPKTARTDHEIVDLLRRRWSPRAFDPDQPVDRADLFRLFEAARWAPSSFNVQPWRFVVADRGRSQETYDALFAALDRSNRMWAGSAPVLVLVAVKTHHDQFDAENTHAWYDTGQAVSLLTVQATALHLAVRQMQGFDADAARAACRIPGGFDPAIVMAVGYPGDPESLEKASHRQAERQPRTRRPISEFVFEGAWGRPVEPGRPTRD